MDPNTNSIVTVDIEDEGTVDAEDVVSEEGSDTFLNITAGCSRNNDNSGLLSICITIPFEGGALVGNLAATHAHSSNYYVTFYVDFVLVS